MSSSQQAANVTQTLPLLALIKLLKAATRRKQAMEGVYHLTRIALPSGLLISAIAVASARIFASPMELAWLGLLPLPMVLLWTYLRPRSLRRIARTLDTHYQLHDQLGNAWELAASYPTNDETKNWMISRLAALAETTAKTLDPRPAIPLPSLRVRSLDIISAGALAVALFVPLPPDTPPQPAHEANGESASLQQEESTKKAKDRTLAEPLLQDLNALQEQSDEISQLANLMLRTLEEFAQGNLDQREALARLEQLEQELHEAEEQFSASLQEDPAILAEALRRLSQTLEQEPITQAAGEELARGQSEAFEKKLMEAAKQAESGGKNEQNALDRSLAASERALQRASEQSSDTQKQLADEERRLRQQEKRPHEDPQEQERRLKKLQRRVEELRRQHEREEAARRQLEELRRAAKQAQGQQGEQGNEKRRQALQKLSRGASQAMRTAQVYRRLDQARSNLEEAKAWIRKEGRNSDSDQQRKQQMQRFTKAAKGKGGKNKSTLLVEGSIGDQDADGMIMDENGQNEGQGQGAQGESDSSSSQNSSDMLVESAAGKGADGFGDGSEDPLGEKTEMASKARNVRVNPQHGQGATRAEIIATASQEGFASVPYQDVYEDYHAFAQSAMDRETLPRAQKRQIKRYFQLIQPR